MRSQPRPTKHFDIRLVPSQDGVPAGDRNPYRDMDEEQREALLMDSLARILRELGETPPAKSAPDSPSP